MSTVKYLVLGPNGQWVVNRFTSVVQYGTREQAKRFETREAAEWCAFVLDGIVFSEVCDGSSQEVFYR